MHELHHSYVWYDCICETWLIRMCDMTHSYVWYDSFIRVKWFIHMWDMTISYAWHDSFMCVTWLPHSCNTTHSHVWHDSCISVTRLNPMCDTTQWSDLFSQHTYENESYHTREWVLSHIVSHTWEKVLFPCVLRLGDQTHLRITHMRMSLITHGNESCHTSYHTEWVLFPCVIRLSDQTHSRMCHTTHSLSRITRMNSFVWHDSFTFVIRLRMN